jgi:DinB superfamily
MKRPTTVEYPEYYHRYAKIVPDGNLMNAFQTCHQNTQLALRGIKNEIADFAYEDGKWTIKQIIQHLIDSERVFAYRALRIGRGDTTALAGFDENKYADAINVHHLSLDELLGEFHMLRLTTMQLFSRFSEEQSLQMGLANDGEISVRALAFIIIGHEIHHLNIIKERYLPEFQNEN